MVNGLFTTVTSCFLRLHGKDSVTTWMKGREAKDLHDFVGSTSLKNIPTSSSWDTFVVDNRVFRCMFLINLDGSALDSRAV